MNTSTGKGQPCRSRLFRTISNAMVIAIVSSAVVVGFGQPAAAIGVLRDHWYWSAQFSRPEMGVLHAGWSEYYRINNSSPGSPSPIPIPPEWPWASNLPDNLDIYGITCVTLSTAVTKVEVLQEYQVDTMGAGLEVSIPVGGAGSVQTDNSDSVVGYSQDRPETFPIPGQWGVCLDYGRDVLWSMTIDWNSDPHNRTILEEPSGEELHHVGRIRMETRNLGRIRSVKHRVILVVYMEGGRIYRPVLEHIDGEGINTERKGPWL